MRLTIWDEIVCFFRALKECMDNLVEQRRYNQKTMEM